METHNAEPRTAAVDGRVVVKRVVFLALQLGLIAQGLVEAAITATLPDMARDFGVNGEFAAQMMLGSGALGLMFGALVSGRLLEWAGARRCFLAALLAFGLFGAAGLFLHDVRLLFAARVVVGMAASCLTTCCLWGISVSYSGSARARVFSVAGATGGVAVLASIVAGGFLTQHFGWRAPFALYPAFALCAWPLAWGGIEQRRPPRQAIGGEGAWGRLLPFYGLVLLFYAIVGMSSMQLPFLLEAHGVLEAGARSLIQSVPGIAAIVGAFSYGALQDRLGAGRAFFASLIFMAAGLAALASSGSVPVIVLGALAVGLCMGLSGPHFYHVVSERATGRAGGRFIGYLNAFTFFGVFLNPLVFEPAKSVLGMSGIYAASALVIVVVGIGAAWRGARAGRVTSPSL
ncbi:MAG: MFS transporter [Proteobacteria bacterium]|nr:MFS transporter [Pseudomonadota bacterium]